MGSKGRIEATLIFIQACLNNNRSEMLTIVYISPHTIQQIRVHLGEAMKRMLFI